MPILFSKSKLEIGSSSTNIQGEENLSSSDLFWNISEK